MKTKPEKAARRSRASTPEITSMNDSPASNATAPRKSTVRATTATQVTTSREASRVNTRERRYADFVLPVDDPCTCSHSRHSADQKRRTTFSHLYQDAKLGSASACFQLGLQYMATEEVWESEELAFGWFERGAIGGDLGAMLELSRCYREGIGIGKDAKLATHWLSRSSGTQAPSKEKSD